MQETYDAVVALTDTFCRENLNDEYRDLARAMTATLCRKPSFASGRPRTWACGILYALGQLNFLSDKATQPYMAMTDVCAAFGVGQRTASGKARRIAATVAQQRSGHGQPSPDPGQETEAHLGSVLPIARQPIHEQGLFAEGPCCHQ
jgi:hypothetical protein